MSDYILAGYLLELVQGLQTAVKEEEEINAGYIAEKCEALAIYGIHTFGNKGRAWGRECCITNLDALKGECNPRLSSNYASHELIGCPECLKFLRELPRETRIYNTWNGAKS